MLPLKAIGSRYSSWLTKGNLRDDFWAGITGAVLVLPQGIAYAIIAGLPPQVGLYTSIIAGTIAALFGSSKHMISGPTAALSMVLSTMLASVYIADEQSLPALVCLVTLMIGLIQLILAFLKVGRFVDFISHSVVQGFTSGAAILIAASQFKYLLGINATSSPTLLGYLSAIFTGLTQTNHVALFIGITTIISAVIWKSYIRRIPYLLGAMVIGSLLCLAVGGQNTYDVAMVSALPGTLPSFIFPDISIDLITTLFPGAVSIAFLGLIEAASISRSIAMRSKQKIDGNKEFIGQGLSNLVGSFFYCYPSSGSFTRSGGNYDSGAKTPISSVISALAVTLVLYLVPNITMYIPMTVMSAGIMVIAWNLFDLKGVLESIGKSKHEMLIFSGTLLSTLFLKLEYAIYVGIVLSYIIFLLNIARPKISEVAPIDRKGRRHLRNINRYNLPECPEVKILRIEGALYFGSVTYIQNLLHEYNKNGIYHFVLILRGVNFIDLSGEHFLLNEINKKAQSTSKVYLCSLMGFVVDSLKTTELKNHFKQDTAGVSSESAIKAAVKGVNLDSCANCSQRVFNECQHRGNQPDRLDFVSVK